MDSLEIEDLKKELKVLRKLDHPNIIHTYEFYEDDNYISIV
jgi:serine/threonine protein kinase